MSTASCTRRGLPWSNSASSAARDRAARIEHVVAEHHVAALDIEADGPWSHHRTYVRRGQVVAIELDIEHAGIDGTLLDAGDQLAQPFRQRNSAALDADQGQVFAAVALLNDLVGQAHQRALNLRGGHQPALHCAGRGCLGVRS